MSDTIDRGANEDYWDELADAYHELTHISCDDFHYGPLIPGDSVLHLLPDPLAGKRCLELACGGAQNSIYLAKRGADCLALDASSKQLEHASELAASQVVVLKTMKCAFEELHEQDLGQYDLVHSSFGLPFADNPEGVIRYIAKNLLTAGGTLLVSLAHPISAGEWLEVEDDGDGMFLKNYFEPPADLRSTESGKCAGSRSYPIGRTIQWLLDAGLTVDAMVEPTACNADAPDFKTRCPYFSEAWVALTPQLSRIPFVYILKATAPA